MSNGNGGAVKVTGDVAKQTIDALKAQPALLVLVILNIVVFSLVAWSIRENNVHRAKRELIMLERCLPQMLK